MNDEFDIIAVFWEDHMKSDRNPIPTDPDEIFDRPTLSVGILVKETDKSIVLASDIERYVDRDDCTFTVILKNCIVGTKKYGSIPIHDLRYSK